MLFRSSHLLVRHLGIPCAHAPALAPLPLDPALDPRAAAEELGHTFLPCVLVGLSRAPDLVPLGPVGASTADGFSGMVSARGSFPEGGAGEALDRWGGMGEGWPHRWSVNSGGARPGFLPGLLEVARLGAVVAPAGALGSEAVLACAARGIPLIAVAGNPCLLQVDGEALGLAVLEAASYPEAAGLVLALREGLEPGGLRRPLPPLDVANG